MIYKLSSIHQKQAIDDGFGEEREAKILLPHLCNCLIVCQTTAISYWDKQRLMTWFCLIFSK